MRLKSLILPLALSLSAPAAFANTFDVTAKVSGFESADGQLIVCLWAEKDGFPVCGKGDEQSLTASAEDGAEVTFTGLAPGEYAITAIHDENGDGKLRQGFGGRPLEPVGLSNNPTGIGRPSFSKAAFTVAENTILDINLR